MRLATLPLIAIALQLCAPVLPSRARADATNPGADGREETPAPAPEEPDGNDELLGGFEDDDFVVPEELDAEIPDESQERLFFSGSLDFTTTFNYLEHRSTSGTSYEGLSMLRARLQLQLDLALPFEWEMRAAGVAFYDLAYLINGRDRYTDEVLEEYEWWVDTKEVWIRGSLLDAIDVEIGRQIVNWGRSDSLRLLDVLNPLDNRHPGLTDIAFLRLPVTMARVRYFRGSWSLSGIAIPELRWSITPPFGSDFHPPFPVSLAPDGGPTLDAPGIPEDDPDPSLANTQWAAALAGTFSGWDASLHFAWLWEDRQHLDADFSSFPSLPPGQLPAIALRRGRYRLYGAGGSRASGSWLFKAELAGLDRLEYTVVAPLPTPPAAIVPAGTVRKWRLDAMVGIEYYGIHDLAIALEAVDRHVFGFEDRMEAFGAVEDQTEIALRITGSFLRERLEATILVVAVGDPAPDSGFLRLSAGYEIRDRLSVEGGIVLYESGDLVALVDIGRNDRVFFKVGYAF